MRTLEEIKTDMIWALHMRPRRGHIYEGTVPQAVVARNRARNKAARSSRRINRVRGAR